MTKASRLSLRILAGLVGVALFGGLSICVFGWHVLHASLPRLSGTQNLIGLSAPVTIIRDVLGTPTVIASNRADLAEATGFLHGQERFFQMDLMRHLGAGRLAELAGPGARALDRRIRPHDFEQRAMRVLALQSPEDRDLLEAYARRVNAGLRSMSHLPFEYTLLRTQPTDWTPKDSLLVVYAMYLDLQASSPRAQEDRLAMQQALGPAMTDFLLPRTTPDDAPVDGSFLPPPPLPSDLPPHPGRQSDMPLPPPEHGSNSMAVMGWLTRDGRAILANDMHLSLNVPNIWYRAHLQERGPHTRDLIGVTLPGEPFIVSGSNNHVAWALTDGYIKTGDAIRLDLKPGDLYQTPDGPRPLRMHQASLSASDGSQEKLQWQDTIWGPIFDHLPDGTPIVWHWSAYDDTAVNYAGFRMLEDARTVQEGITAAHRAGLPQQNILLADSAGHIAWTIIGPVPQHGVCGVNDLLPHAWADGTCNWRGYMPPDTVPTLIDPASGRLWTANGRVVGGAMLATLGDGGYADGARAGRIRDDLNTRSRFTEADLLAIETDDHATAMMPWQKLLIRALREGENPQPIIDAAEHWGEHAIPSSTGYRLAHDFRVHALRIVFGAYTSIPMSARSVWSVQTLLTRKPHALIPPGFASWEAVDRAIITALRNDIDHAGGLSHFTWGDENHVGIHHPLAKFVPGLSYLTDPADLPEAGDTMIPRVQVPGFGASERQVISPGHEENGLFDMPMGNAANPLSPYFGAGEADWVAGRAGPLLPGPPRWTLTLVP